MVWIITIYLFLSVAIAIAGAMKAGVVVGLSAFGGSFVAVVSAGGLKFGLFWGDRAQKIGIPIIAVLLLTFAYWLSGGFSAQLFGVTLSGERLRFPLMAPPAPPMRTSNRSLRAL